MNNTNSNLSAPLRMPINLNEIDGRRIVTTIDYQMLINLHLTLVTYDKDTNLVTLLAEDYDIQDKTITFRLKKGVKTVSGHEIKAIDAELSLKRVIAAKASHSRLKELLCPDIENNRCSNILSNEYELKLIAQKKSYIPFILSLLASADNVILPLTALDSSLPSSNIINFKETSGPYFIDHKEIENKALDSIELSINPEHFLYNEKLSKKVLYTVIKEDELIQGNSLNKKFNYIHNVLSVSNENIDKLNHENSELSFFNTAFLRNSMIFTTESGRAKFSSSDLINHALYLKSELFKHSETYPNVRHKQVEFFATGSDGSLRSDQLQTLLKKYADISQSQPKIPSFTLGLYPSHFKRYNHLFDKKKHIKIVEITREELLSQVDFFLDTIDSSIEESLDALEYNKNFGIFKVTDEEIKKYVDSESKQERIRILQNIHFDSLMNGYFVVLGTSPYTTILSKDWHADPSTIQVGFPVWKITKKN